LDDGLIQMGVVWSQSPVLPRTKRAYETHLSAGSTAVLADGHQNWSPHAELHPPTLGATAGQAGLKLAYRASTSLTMI